MQTDTVTSNPVVSNIDGQIRIRILEMMISRLRIANYGNLLLVFAIAGFLWSRISQDFLVGWVLVNIAITFIRIKLVYKRYERTHIDESNVRMWLIMFCISLGVTNLVWAAAFPQFIAPNSPSLVVIVMFCFFTIIASGIGTLSVYMPAFFSHGVPLVSVLATYFFMQSGPNDVAYGLAVLLFYFVAALLAKTGNKDMQTLMRLQIEKQEIAEELEQKKELAEQASLEKDRFLAAASHDLRQPLHSASLLLSSLSRYVKEPPAVDILNDTKNAIKALNHSFSSLLDVSKLDAGVVTPQLQHISIANILQKLAKEYLPRAQQKGLELVIEESQCTIYSDKALTERILRNLLSNAIQYTDSGSITITSYTEGGQVEIKVADTGPGIAAEQQALIFSEYYQVNNPERDRSQGFGLGLSIVKRLAILLGGKIRLESTEAQGSAFTITLMEGQASKVVTAPTSAIDLSKFNNLKVLVIEDDSEVRKAIKTVINGWNCSVLLSESSDEAIRLMNEEDFIPELILADYRLRNNQTGVEAIEKVRDELNNQIPAIIITGDTSPKRIKEASNSGFQLLHKPVAAPVLRAAMQKSLRKN